MAYIQEVATTADPACVVINECVCLCVLMEEDPPGKGGFDWSPTQTAWHSPAEGRHDSLSSSWTYANMKG